MFIEIYLCIGSSWCLISFHLCYGRLLCVNTGDQFFLIQAYRFALLVYDLGSICVLVQWLEHRMFERGLGVYFCLIGELTGHPEDEILMWRV